jgi:hypothetical protein
VNVLRILLVVVVILLIVWLLSCCNRMKSDRDYAPIVRRSGSLA